MRKIILLFGLIWIQCQMVLSQPYSSKDNYTGDWKTPSSWIPTWTALPSTISGYDVIINGYITLKGSLYFSGTASNLIVNDTLVIKGDLSLGNNNNNLIVNDKGILIIRGNLTINNQSNIVANGYLIVTGNIIKTSSVNHGTIISNDNPVKIFVGETISSVGLTDNNTYYPALNCTAPLTKPYPNSKCSYGNLTDIKSNPIVTFFNNTCAISDLKSNSPVCVGKTIDLTASGGIGYSWSGANGFASNAQNPSIPNANTTMAGDYIVTVTADIGCTITDTINVIINKLPVVTVSSNSPVCEGDTLYFTSSGGTEYSWHGTNDFISSAQNPSIPNTVTKMTGVYTVTASVSSSCSVTDTINVIINALPLVNITSSNDIMCINDLRKLVGNPTGGKFTITKGSGTITDDNILSTNEVGNINLEYYYTDICPNKATQSILVEKLNVNAGSDQELKTEFETQMKAELSLTETGEWSLISGSGHINDIHSPTTTITKLSTGENVFAWKVKNDNCEASDEVKITVDGLFIPSVITPNGDGKNDYFQISDIREKVELIIFNRWGNEEYTNTNYSNNWDGRNNNGKELPTDTYFYILKFAKGQIKKGSILIKR